MMAEGTPEEMQAELDELRSKTLLYESELEGLRPLAVRQRIADAGVDPDSSDGKVLAELASHDSSLAGSAKRMAKKASELGLTGSGSGSTKPDAGPELADPRYGPNHPRNKPGTHAHRQALREAEKASKTGQVLSQMVAADADGQVDGQPAQPPAQPGQAPAPVHGPKGPAGPPGYDDSEREAYREKSASVISQMLGTDT